MYFCIRDDDTSFFTSPDELERAYGEVTKCGPVSLAIIPFCRAGTSRGIPKAYREQWSTHPLAENKDLVQYLRYGIANRRYEAMLHGYHHDEPGIEHEFVGGSDLRSKIRTGRQYLENVLQTKIRVFVPPHNAISRSGLDAVSREGLHLGCVAGMRQGWSWLAPASVKTWWRLRNWRTNGHVGIPWVLELSDHRELAGNPVTPSSTFKHSKKLFDEANEAHGVFCAATHYWELDHPTEDPDSLTVGDHLRELVQQVVADPKIRWISVGDVLAGNASVSRDEAQ